MTRLSPALNDLVELGFEALQRPHSLDTASALARHAAIVAELGQRFPTQRHFLHGAEALVQALDHLAFYRRSDPDQAPAWEALVGTALVITRAQAWASINWEREHLS